MYKFGQHIFGTKLLRDIYNTASVLFPILACGHTIINNLTEQTKSVLILPTVVEQPCMSHKVLSYLLTELDVRLIGGASPSEGRVELRSGDGIWKSVCDKDFGYREARMVCKMLHYPM